MLLRLRYETNADTEALNEAITGGPWPPKAERNARLKQSAEVIRALWTGETVSTRGHIVTARVIERADPAVRLILAGDTP